MRNVAISARFERFLIPQDEDVESKPSANSETFGEDTGKG